MRKFLLLPLLGLVLGGCAANHQLLVQQDKKHPEIVAISVESGTKGGPVPVCIVDVGDIVAMDAQGNKYYGWRFCSSTIGAFQNATTLSAAATTSMFGSIFHNAIATQPAYNSTQSITTQGGQGVGGAGGAAAGGAGGAGGGGGAGGSGASVSNTNKVSSQSQSNSQTSSKAVNTSGPVNVGAPTVNTNVNPTISTTSKGIGTGTGTGTGNASSQANGGQATSWQPASVPQN